jgi:translation initiation factor IF-1
LPAPAANRRRRTGSKPNRSSEQDRTGTDGEREADPQTFRTTGTVKTVLRDAKFLVVTEHGLEIVARAAGRMRRGRKIRILAGDAVDLEVSLYDPTRGRIIWRHV